MGERFMTVFVDTCIFVALRNADDEHHERSKGLMRRALKGEFGSIYMSDYVIDEAMAIECWVMRFSEGFRRSLCRS